MKKKLFLGACAVALSPLWGDASAPVSAKPVEASVGPQDIAKLKGEEANFLKLEKEFEKWGVETVWSQVHGINSNEHGSQEAPTAYSLFADTKMPMMAFSKDKIISADPLKNGKTEADMPHIKQIMDALKASTDGKIVVEYTRMEKNPADNNNTVAVKYKAFAWDQRAFNIKDHDFFVFIENPS